VTSRRSWTLLLLLLLAAACSSSSPSATDGDAGQAPDAATREPENHRAQANACSAPRAPGTPNPSPPAGAPCTKDPDCTAGQNGRCENNPIGAPEPLSNACSYDQCATDADCGGPKVCDCRNAGARDANVCVAGDCRVDLDCGAGRWCSPSATDVAPSCLTGIEPGSIGYFCHTSSDECTDDRDCPSGEKCLFLVAAMHWACVQKRCTL
jgi:Cys-rich repeat protein